MTATELDASPLRSRPTYRRWHLKRYLPRTLFGRSLAIIVTPVVLAQLVAAWIFYDRHWETITSRLSFSVAAETAFIIKRWADAADEAERARILRQAQETMDLVVTFLPGQTLPTPPRPLRGLLEPAMAKELRSKVDRRFTINTRIAHEWYEIRVELEGGVMQVLSPERRLYTPTTYIFLFWMVGSALVLFAIAIVFMRNQIRPIRRLAAAADDFGKGRDVPEFRPEGAAEVRQAANAFLVMRARLQRQIGQRTAMLAGVSHDLRTPLTRMKLQLAMLGEGQEIEDLKSDVVEMEAMIDGYLAFARGEGAEPVEETDLAALVSDVVAGARRSGGQVVLNIDDDLVLPLRANAIRRGLSNLLANARRHAGHVWVTGNRHEGVIEIIVDDDGPGIPPSERENVFKPFYRLDRSRNVETGGTGLGLTIARDAVRGMGGELSLHESPRGGLRVLVRLPL